MYQTKVSITDHIMMIVLGLINNAPWIIGVASADRIVAQFDKPLYLGLINFANFFSGIPARFLNTWLTSKNASYIIQHFVNLIAYMVGVAGLAVNNFWIVWGAMFIVGFCSTYGESVLLCYINYRCKVSLMKSFSIGTGLAGFIGAGYSLIVKVITINYFWSFIGLIPIFFVSMFAFWWLHTKSSNEPEENSDAEYKLISGTQSIAEDDRVSMWDCSILRPAWSNILNCSTTYFFAYVIQTNFAHCSVKASQSKKYNYMYSLLNLMYQIGLLGARIAFSCVKLPRIGYLTLIEGVLFIIWMAQAFTKFMNVYICCATIIIVGIASGTSYSNAFNNIMNIEHLSNKEREMATSWNALFYTTGIMLSAIWTTITENTFMAEYVTLK